MKNRKREICTSGSVMRNINFNGADTGVNGIRITGGAVIGAGVVIIEDCLIDGNFGGAARGISD